MHFLIRTLHEVNWMRLTIKTKEPRDQDRQKRRRQYYGHRQGVLQNKKYPRHVKFQDKGDLLRLIINLSMIVMSQC